MQARSSILFPPFMLDVNKEQLWRDSQTIALRPKTFAVLLYLVEHPDVLVTKNALLDAVWPTAVVTDGVLKTCVRELRHALGDDDKAPRFIETVHGRGYRFIALLSTSQPASQKSKGKSQKSTPIPSTQHPIPTLVGREAELAQLYREFSKALHGERRIIFVTGEPGIGKTTLVEAFLAGIGQQGPGNGETENQKAKREDPTPHLQHPAPEVWVGRGQCVEQYGVGEAYMPILEALGRLCREPGGERLVALLHHHAPTWLVQMPAVLNPVELETLQRKTQDATRERMLRELAEAMVALTAEQPLVLWLEDLHWSDRSTLELLSVLARWQEPARLLVIGSYRPEAMLAGENPLRAVTQELQLHKHCEEIRLGLLTANEVASYLASRLADRVANRAALDTLARAVHQRTEGNPLFMVTVVDDLDEQRALTDGGEALQGVPATLQQLIERQLDRLPPEEQRVLEVASVVGVDFSAAAVAAGLEMTPSEIETCCSGLARREHFVRTSGISEWPDGTLATRYSFLHALYREVLYECVPIGRRVLLHRHIGIREEHAYGNQAQKIAAELALHFERGRDYPRALTYHQYAGETALQRYAPGEAVSHLTAALQLLHSLPEGPERNQTELRVQATLGPALIAIKGYAAPEVGEAYHRAQILCQQLEENSQLAPVLMGRWMFLLVRGELHAARALGEQLVAHAQRTQDSDLLAEAHWALGESLVMLGEFPQARQCLEQGIAHYDHQKHATHAVRYGQDPGITCGLFVAWALWLLGYPEQAYARAREALHFARALSHPNSEAFAEIGGVVWLDQATGKAQATQHGTERVMELAHEHGLSFWSAMAKMYRGWALALQGRSQEGIAQLYEGLAAYRATGAEADRPFFLTFLADACRAGALAEEGLAAISEALTMIEQQKGNGLSEAELYRLRGELLLVQVKHRKQRTGNRQKTEGSSQRNL